MGNSRVISLVTDEDGILSSAIIDNDLWTSNETEIRQVISDAQFGIEVDMSIEGLHPDHNVHNMGDLASWLSSVEQFR